MPTTTVVTTTCITARMMQNNYTFTAASTCMTVTSTENCDAQSVLMTDEENIVEGKWKKSSMNSDEHKSPK